MTAPRAIVGVLALAIVPIAGQGGSCKQADEEYHAARSVVFGAMETYERCIDASQGRSECGDELAELDLAQTRQQRALVEYRKACR